jgi:acetylornithine deacetylase/succinyl-diaminopimelate desuccinylase-like protein
MTTTYTENLSSEAGNQDDAVIAELHYLLETLVAIGAPTFQEERRSRFIENWLRENVDAEVGRDELGNVWVDLSNGANNVHLLDAHIDTVFPFEQVDLRKEDGIWHAPGVSDNTGSCAVLMIWAKHHASRAHPLPFLLSFTVGEENEGSLVGIKRIVQDFGQRMVGACILDLRLATGCHKAVGSNRYHLHWEAQGGHSWGAFGNTSAIHEMVEWIHSLKDKYPWQNGLHSYNAGYIEGGTGATSIAESAVLKLDVRSTDPQFLESFRASLQEKIEASASDDRAATITLLSYLERPAGFIAADHPLVDIVKEVHAELEVPLTFGVFSTNANALYDKGISAVTTGVSVGAGVHTEQEHLELASLAVGYKKLCLLAEKIGVLSEKTRVETSS